MHPDGFLFRCSDFAIQLLAMIRVVGQGGIDFSQCQLGMVQGQFRRAPPVGNMLANQMNNFKVLARDQRPLRIGAVQMFISIEPQLT